MAKGGISLKEFNKILSSIDNVKQEPIKSQPIDEQPIQQTTTPTVTLPKAKGFQKPSPNELVNEQPLKMDNQEPYSPYKAVEVTGDARDTDLNLKRILTDYSPTDKPLNVSQIPKLYDLAKKTGDKQVLADYDAAMKSVGQTKRGEELQANILGDAPAIEQKPTNWNLSPFEARKNKYEGQDYAALKNAGDDISKGWEDFTNEVLPSMTAGIMGIIKTAASTDLTGTAAGQEVFATQQVLGSLTDSDWFKQYQKTLRDTYKAQGKKREADPYWDENLGSLIASAPITATSFLAAGAPAIIARIAKGAAFAEKVGAIAGMTSAFATEAGLGFEEAKKYGTDDQTAFIASIPIGVANAYLEYLPIKSVLDDIGVTKEIKKDIAEKFLVGENLANFAKTILAGAAKGTMEEGYTEALQELTPLIAESIYKKAEDKPTLKQALERMAQSGIAGATTGLFMGGGGGIVSGTRGVIDNIDPTRDMFNDIAPNISGMNDVTAPITFGEPSVVPADPKAKYESILPKAQQERVDKTINRLTKQLDAAIQNNERFDETRIAAAVQNAETPEQQNTYRALYIKALEHNQNLQKPVANQLETTPEQQTETTAASSAVVGSVENNNLPTNEQQTEQVAEPAAEPVKTPVNLPKPKNQELRALITRQEEIKRTLGTEDLTNFSPFDDNEAELVNEYNANESRISEITPKPKAETKAEVKPVAETIKPVAEKPVAPVKLPEPKQSQNTTYNYSKWDVDEREDAEGGKIFAMKDGAKFYVPDSEVENKNISVQDAVFKYINSGKAKNIGSSIKKNRVDELKDEIDVEFDEPVVEKTEEEHFNERYKMISEMFVDDTIAGSFLLENIQRLRDEIPELKEEEYGLEYIAKRKGELKAYEDARDRIFKENKQFSESNGIIGKQYISNDSTLAGNSVITILSTRNENGIQIFDINTTNDILNYNTTIEVGRLRQKLQTGEFVEKQSSPSKPAKPVSQNAIPAAEVVKPEIVEQPSKPKAETAREQGYFIDTNGERVERNKPINHKKGEDANINFTLKDKEKGSYVIVEADDLVPSHVGKERNPKHFIPEAQPKGRESGVSGSNTPKNMAANLDPEQIGISPSAYIGAPVVNERGEVIQGNGRTMAIKEYYQGNKTNYPEWLEANKAKFGIDSIEGFKKPVLVRMVKADDKRAIQLGQYEASDMESVKNNADTQRANSNKLTDEVIAQIAESLNDADPESTLKQVITKDGADIIKILVDNEVLRGDEAADKYLNGNNINEAGKNYVFDMLLSALFKGRVNIPTQYRNNIPSAIQSAMEKALIYILRVDKAKSLVSDIQDAIEAYSIFKNSGITNFTIWLQSSDMVDGTPVERFSPRALTLAYMFKNITKHDPFIKPFISYSKLILDQKPDFFNPEGVKGKSKTAAFKEAFGEYNDELVKIEPKASLDIYREIDNIVNSVKTLEGATESESRAEEIRTAPEGTASELESIQESIANQETAASETQTAGEVRELEEELDAEIKNVLGAMIKNLESAQPTETKPTPEPNEEVKPARHWGLKPLSKEHAAKVNEVRKKIMDYITAKMRTKGSFEIVNDGQEIRYIISGDTRDKGKYKVSKFGLDNTPYSDSPSLTLDEAIDSLIRSAELLQPKYEDIFDNLIKKEPTPEPEYQGQIINPEVVEDLRGNDTGWDAYKYRNGTVIKNSSTGEEVEFLTNNANSGTEKMRQNSLAQAYAIENKVERPKKQNDSEKITAAAIKTKNGQIFHGTSHPTIYLSLADQGVIIPEDAAESGFLTNTGRFVSREEASRIAKAAEQIKNNAPIKIDSYGFSPYGLPDAKENHTDVFNRKPLIDKPTKTAPAGDIVVKNIKDGKEDVIKAEENLNNANNDEAVTRKRHKELNEKVKPILAEILNGKKSYELSDIDLVKAWNAISERIGIQNMPIGRNDLGAWAFYEKSVASQNGIKVNTDGMLGADKELLKKLYEDSQSKAPKPEPVKLRPAEETIIRNTVGSFEDLSEPEQQRVLKLREEADGNLAKFRQLLEGKKEVTGRDLFTKEQLAEFDKYDIDVSKVTAKYKEEALQSLEEKQAGTMSNDDVRKEYLRTDLTRAVDDADLAPVLQLHLRKIFGLYTPKLTPIAEFQIADINDAAKEIIKKLGKQYPELKSTKLLTINDVEIPEANKPTTDNSATTEKQEVKPAEKPKIEQIDKEIEDTLNDMIKNMGKLNSGIDPEQLALGLKLTGLYVKKGIYKLADIAKAVYGKIGEQKFIKLFDAIKTAYSSYYNSADDDVFEQLDDARTVRKLTADDVINSIKDEQDVPDRTNAGKPDSEVQSPAPDDKTTIRDDGRTSGEKGNETPGTDSKTDQRNGSQSGNDLFSPAIGTQGNLSLFDQDETTAPAESDAGSFDGRGNSITGNEGYSEYEQEGLFNDSEDIAAVSSGFISRQLENKKKQQKAESIPVKVADIDNIKETLPYLLPAQQEDVLRAEKRFNDPVHQTKEAAYGKGYLFTNGTGTGKTYVGLGIIKRFVKQGKKNILIVTPSQPKVSDWIEDGKNLGLNISALKDTNDAGTGVVITTFANFRANQAISMRDFDLIVYDESHRIMESKGGDASSTTGAHYSHGNASEWYAEERLKSFNPLWIKEKDLREKIRQLDKEKYKAPKTQEQIDKILDEIKEIESELSKVKDEQAKVLPKIQERAKAAYQNTKVVFLSATPFKAHFNLRYANKFLFDWGTEETRRGHSRVDAESEFFLQNFSAAYEWKFHRLQVRAKANAEAVALQETEFAEKLKRNGVMSGQVIDSDFDYARYFPIVADFDSGVFNRAFSDIFDYTNKTFELLREEAIDVFFEYNYTTQLFESLKAGLSIPRIKEHLKLGRQVVVFHRRHQGNATPPFSRILTLTKFYAKAIFEDDNSSPKERAKAAAALEQVELFTEKYSDLLEYEKTLDYRPAVEQLKAAFPGQVGFVNGTVSTKEKNKAIKEFNDDNSKIKIIVVQEESGKEGISLHDTTGKHQRALLSLSMPISTTTGLQVEGRIYRIGQASNAIFEYPLLGLDLEIAHFGQNFNKRVSTTENLAMGVFSRDLLRAFSEGVLNADIIPAESETGEGGKQYDKRLADEKSLFQKAKLVYAGAEKLRGKRDERAGFDFYPTPEPIGLKMVEWANLKPQDSMLEPSAGSGSIAMWTPEDVKLTAIEPSFPLYGKLTTRAQGAARKLLQDTFENLHVVNKFDAIVMNPPFGTAGKTAIDHVKKAFSHLHETGRIVALLPEGSGRTKLDKWLEEEEDAVLRNVIHLPEITFVNAGFTGNTFIAIIDKISPENRENEYLDQSERTIKADSIDELFDNIENVYTNDRIVIEPKSANLSRSKEVVPETTGNEASEIKTFKHSKTGETIYSVKLNTRLTNEEFATLKRKATSEKGYYSSYNKDGAIPGFHFKDADAATQFNNFINKTLNSSDTAFSIIPDSADPEISALREKHGVSEVLNGQKTDFSIVTKDFPIKTAQEDNQNNIFELDRNNPVYNPLATVEQITKVLDELDKSTHRKFRFSTDTDSSLRNHLGAVREQIIDLTKELNELPDTDENIRLQFDLHAVRLFAFGTYANIIGMSNSAPGMFSIVPDASETDRIISDAKKNGTYLKAPNGQPTKLNPFQWAQVRTKAFKEWFGDWENSPDTASKVIDENGEPLVVYHGTPYGRFYTFKGSEFFFSENRNFARYYADEKAMDRGIDGDIEVIDAFLSPKNVFNPMNPTDLDKIIKLLPDEISTLFGKPMKKEDFIRRMKGEGTQPPMWTKEQIKNAKFGRSIGETFDGFNNDVFVGIDNQDNVVYVSNAYRDSLRYLTEQEKEELINGSGKVKYKKYRLWGNGFSLDELREMRNEGRIDENDWVRAISNIDSGEISAYKTTQEAEEYTGADNWSAFELANEIDLVEEIKKLGYDSLKITERGKNNYVVFKPNQIKSATANIGAFSAENDDIRFAALNNAQKLLAYEQDINNRIVYINEQLKRDLTPEKRTELQQRKSAFLRELYSINMAKAVEQNKLNRQRNPNQTDLFGQRELFDNQIVPNPVSLESIEYAETMVKRIGGFKDVPVHFTQEAFDRAMSEINATRVAKGLAPMSSYVAAVRHNGEVYYNPAGVSKDAPLHEFGHVWYSWAKTNRPDLIKQAKKLLEGSDILKEIREIYKDIYTDEEQIIEEAIVTAIGRYGTGMLEAKGKTSKLAEWVEKLWNAIKMALRIKPSTDLSSMTLQQFAEKIASDIINNDNLKAARKIDKLIKNSSLEEAQFQILGESGAQNIAYIADNLSVAKDMEAKNKDAKTIRLATGWEKGVDGKWRYEIPDEIKFAYDKITDYIYSKENTETVLADLLEPDAVIFKAYPELKNVTVMNSDISGEMGSTVTDKNTKHSTITVNKPILTADELDSVLLHEIQHVIQDIEGFAKGGNRLLFWGEYNKLNERVRQINVELSRASYFRNMDKYDELLEERSKVVKELRAYENEFGSFSGMKQYKQLAGEVESRNVQNRMNLTPEERRNILLSETEDVARDQQIILQESVKSFSIADNVRDDLAAGNIGRVPLGEKEQDLPGYNKRLMNSVSRDDIIRALEEMRPFFNELRNNRVSDEQVINAALRAFMGLNDAYMLTIKPGSVANAVQALAMRIYAEAKARSAIRNLAKVQAKPKDEQGKDELISARLEVQNAKMIYAKHRAVGTELGRALRIFGMPMDNELLNMFSNTAMEVEKDDPALADELKKFVDEDFGLRSEDIRNLQKALDEVNRLEQELDALSGNADALRAERDRIREIAADNEETINHLNNQSDAAADRITVLEQQLDDLTLESEAERLEFIKLTRELLELNDQLNKANEMIAELKKQLEALNEQIKGLQKQLDEALKPKDEKTVKKADKERKKVGKIKDAITRAIEGGKKNMDQELIAYLRLLRKMLKSREEKPDTGAIDDIIKKAPRFDIFHKLLYWRYQSMLSNVVTDMRNVLGNTFMLTSELGMVAAFNPRSVAELYRGLRDGLREGGQEAAKIWNGKEAARTRFIEHATHNTDKFYDWKPTSKLGQNFKRINALTRLEMEDAIFWNAARQVAVRKAAIKLAGKENMPKTVQEMQQLIDDVINKKYDDKILEQAEQKFKDFKGTAKERDEALVEYIQTAFSEQRKALAEASKYADDFADYLTFRRNIKGVSNITKFFEWTADENLGVRAGKFLGRSFILPFIRVPANMLLTAIDYSPLGFAKYLDNQKRTVYEKQDIARRAVAGTLVLSSVIGLIAAGLLTLTGEPPKDKDQRAWWEEMGFRPNMIYINVGGKWKGISYQWMPGVSVILAMVGNYLTGNYSIDKKNEDDGVITTVATTLFRTAESITNQSFMQGTNDFFNALKGESEGYIDKQILGLVPNIATLPKTIKQNATGDFTIYRTESLSDKARQRFGFGTDALQPMIGIDGENRQSTYESIPIVTSLFYGEADPDKSALGKFFRSHPLLNTPQVKKFKDEGKEISEQQYTLYARKYYKIMSIELRSALGELKALPADEAQDLINRIAVQARKEAKSFIF